MQRFLQLHLLTSYPPSNVNRDDLGRPKTAVMGGAMRLRISSQSLKRAWRTSEVFESALSGHVGTRTKQMGVRVYKLLMDKGANHKDAHKWAATIAEQFGKRKSGSSKSNDEEDVSDYPELEIQQLAHFSPEEIEAIDRLVEELASRGKGPEKQDLDLLRKSHSAADIALFGRMLADAPPFNVEGAAQVAHALTVHKVAVESDYFTAVDDLNTGEKSLGAAHIGENEFGAGLYYLYVCVDRQLLKDNLEGDGELVRSTLGALVECAATISPSGKQNSFGSRAHAVYLLAEKGDQQPRSLSVAFLTPINGTDMASAASKRLMEMKEKMDQAYEGCSDAHEVMDVDRGTGTLRQIVAFAQECHA